MKAHHSRWANIALFFLASAVGNGAFGQSAEWTIEDLRVLARERRESIGSLHAKFVVAQEPLPDRPSDVYIKSITRDVTYDANSGRYVIERTIELSDATPPIAVLFRFDGEISSLYVAELSLGAINAGPQLLAVPEVGPLAMLLMAPPADDGVGLDDGSLESFLAHATLREQFEMIGDRPCVVIDAWKDGVNYATLWLDIERDLMPARRVVYARDGGIASDVTIEESVAAQDSHGTWVHVPTRWASTAALGGGRVTARALCDPQSIEIDPPLDDELFWPQFPTWTNIADHRTGLLYTLGPDGEAIDYVPDAAAESPSAATAPALRLRDAEMTLARLMEGIQFLRSPIGGTSDSTARPAELRHGLSAKSQPARSTTPISALGPRARSDPLTQLEPEVDRAQIGPSPGIERRTWPWILLATGGGCLVAWAVLRFRRGVVQ